jgi:putative Mg2+ transporter-C (MgtC) family protein
MTFDSLLAALHDGDVMLPLLCSLGAGALIGMEREFQNKPAGLRTHTLVCFASALMTLLGLRMAEWVAVLPADAQIVSDMARMPHAILTGIGFLGAGVIFREGANVQGLTTAASLWLTAALGIVFGTGLLELGTLGTVAALLVLILLRTLQRLTPPRPVVRLELAVTATSDFAGETLKAILAGLGLQAGPLSLRHDRQRDLRHYGLMISAQSASLDCEALARALQADAAVQEFSIVPLENEAAMAEVV